MRNHLFVGAAVAALIAPAAVQAQETTSTIRGTVTENGAPVAGAAVLAVHVPSGTRAATSTAADGSFTLTGLRPGGPYTVSVNGQQAQVTDIYTVLAQPYELPIDLTAQGQDIVVTASNVQGARVVSEGPATVLNAEQIGKVASINRDIRDLMRRDPFANIDKSSAVAAVSFAGQNPRFNRFTIDGVPITDSFGLNPDGLPSRRGPVPLDAIGQFETKVAPYDIREGFFQGGVVNAVLKSGTNEFHGTGFYSYLDDSMVGKQTKPYAGNATGKVTVPPFKNEDYGFELSGPIIKDKLFFMISGERVRAASPYPYGTVEDNGGVPVTNLTNAQLSAIVAAAKSRYNYDAGGIVRNNGDKDDRLVGRLDANLSDTQRLSLTGIYTKDELISLTNTGTGTLSLESGSYIKPNTVYAGIAQLNSDWTDTFSTEFRGLYKQYDSGQIPRTARAAQVTVCTAAASDRPGTGAGADTFNLATSCPTNVAQVQLGTGGPSQANELHIKTYGGSFVARLAAGEHNFRALFETQYTKTFNIFVNGALGTYYFDSIADFQAGNAQSFSYTNSPSLNPNDAAAKFNYQVYTFGLQDNWRVSDQLNVSYGVRWDSYGGSTLPAFNPIFLNRYGLGNNAYINGKELWQPRVGFDYTPTSRLTIRGGAGIFGGGTPDVYLGNSFSNTGVLSTTLTARLSDQGRYQINGQGNPTGSDLLNNVNIQTVPAIANTLLSAQGTNLTANPNNTTTLNALDPKFKIPSQWRATLSARWDADLGPLGDHWRFGLDGFYSKVRNQVAIVDLRSAPVTGSFTPDGRQRYASVITAAPTDSGADYLLTNSDKGRSYVAVASVSKAWDFGLSANASFTYENVKDNQAFTSSIANSNYSNGAYRDPNSLTGGYGHSNDEVPYSFKYNLSFDHAFFGDYRTRIDLFGETRQGYNYSWGFQDVSSGRSSVFGTVASSSRYLFYVPKVNDPLVTYKDTATQTSVENLINSTSLKDYRGKIAPRNAFHSKWFTRLDLHVEQELPVPGWSQSRVTVFADIENFTNLINHDWGQQLRANFPYIKTVVKVACVAQGTNSCAQYQYSSPTSDLTRADSLVNGSLGASLYAIRVGAR
ncbi:MAG TPA: carboxypeptidase regulatory-like domain-containing protein, partial [Sphingomonas sp.]|nr:carboxypeptidase regulatory-like domain-containing protein [Sphingomonas sp.]